MTSHTLLAKKSGWLSAVDIADELNISKSTAYLWLAEGCFGPVVKLSNRPGGAVRVTVAGVREFLSQRLQVTAETMGTPTGDGFFSDLSNGCKRPPAGDDNILSNDGLPEQAARLAVVARLLRGADDGETQEAIEQLQAARDFLDAEIAKKRG